MSKESEAKAAAEVLRVETVMATKAAEQKNNVDIAADNIAAKQALFDTEKNMRSEAKGRPITRQYKGGF